jgi:MFS family permease
MTALPLLATELTTDPSLIAGLAVAERLPWLVFILPGGAWADRYDRRRLRVLLDVIRAVVVAVLAMLIAVDAASLVALYLAAAAMAAAESVVDSSSMALVPALVDDADLERGGARLAATELTMGALIGPPLGGLMFASALWLPFGADAITFLLAAVLAAAIPGTFRPARDRMSKTSIWSDIGGGIPGAHRRAARHRSVRHSRVERADLGAASAHDPR